MDHASAMEERIRRKMEEVNAAAQQHLAGVQDHVNFTMQVSARWLRFRSPGDFFCGGRGSGIAGGASWNPGLIPGGEEFGNFLVLAL
jgi:hypothetical protein